MSVATCRSVAQEVHFNRTLLESEIFDRKEEFWIKIIILIFFNKKNVYFKLDYFVLKQNFDI